MGDTTMAKEKLAQAIEEMRNKTISPSEFYKKLMGVLATLDVKDEDLQGITPQLLAFVNGLIKNMS
jgi:hypothetical protein